MAETLGDIMTPEIQAAVIQKQALSVANLTLSNTVLEVQLDAANARIAELEAAQEPPAE